MEGLIEQFQEFKFDSDSRYKLDLELLVKTLFSYKLWIDQEVLNEAIFLYNMIDENTQDSQLMSLYYSQIALSITLHTLKRYYPYSFMNLDGKNLEQIIIQFFMNTSFQQVKNANRFINLSNLFQEKYINNCYQNNVNEMSLTTPVFV